MKRSAITMIIIVLVSILFGFLLTIIPNYFPIFEIKLDRTMVSITVLCLFISFFVMTIGIYIHSHFLISKSKFINTMIPFRTFDSMEEDQMITFYNNMKKMVGKTTKSLIYVTYPVSIYESNPNQTDIYTTKYYKTRAGKELKGLHKYILKQVKKMIGAKKRMQFKMFIQNRASNNEENIDINNKHLDRDTKAFFNKIEQSKKRVRSQSKHGSSINYYNINSNSETIAVIVDNRYMLMLTKVFDKYVASFVKDQVVVKDITAHLFATIIDKQ